MVVCIVDFEDKMTICMGSPLYALEFVFPLIITLLVYFLFLKKRLNKNWKQKLSAILLAVAIFVVLAIIGSLISLETGIGCTGPEVDWDLGGAR